MPDLLIFASGGLAYAERRDAVALQNEHNTATASRSSSKSGYVAGGGVEYALDQHWSVKAEALYYDLGTTRAVAPVLSGASPVPPGRPGGFGIPPVLGQVQAVSHDRGVIGRVGLNYRFSGW
jgi:outer membrane immunogenic protein